MDQAKIDHVVEKMRAIWNEVACDMLAGQAYEEYGYDINPHMPVPRDSFYESTRNLQGSSCTTS